MPFPSVPRLMIVRHPLARLLSAFLGALHCPLVRPPALLSVSSERAIYIQYALSGRLGSVDLRVGWLKKDSWQQQWLDAESAAPRDVIRIYHAYLPSSACIAGPCATR